MGQCFSSSRSSEVTDREDFRALNFSNGISAEFSGSGGRIATSSHHHHHELSQPSTSASGGQVLEAKESFSGSTAGNHHPAGEPSAHTPTVVIGGRGGLVGGKTPLSGAIGNFYAPDAATVNGALNTSRSSLDTVITVVALYQYESRSDGDLSFEKGDVMQLLDHGNNDWWYVRNAKSISGYVPRTFVALQKTLESEEWFAGRLSRSQAERLVASRNLPNGTFLIRERDSDQLEYALTIRDMNTSHGNFVKHYKIKQLDNNEGFFITTRVIFRSLQELVAYYSERPDGLCCRLTFAAPKIAPTRPDLSHETQAQWEVPRNQFRLKDKLGDGNFGEVWRGEWKGVVEVAIKTMKPGTMSSDAFLEEAQIMKQCDHPNLVKLYAVCTKEEPFYIVTEYMVGGSLLYYLRNEKIQIPDRANIDKCTQIANGMKYLEERKLVHRDLAARNVLVGEKISGVPVVKVADFGLARKLMEEDIYEARTGAKFPIKWTAPEAATQGSFTVKSDVWSYGILLYEIFTRGQVPYPGMHNREVIEQVELGYRLPMPKNCPEQVYTEIMLKCWDKHPDRRPTFAFLYSFFDDYFVSSQPNYIPP